LPERISNDLSQGISLISVGVVDDAGETFYMELEMGKHGWSMSKCSTFTMDVVLPLLQGGDCVGTNEEVATKLQAWIEKRHVEQVMSDHIMDWHFFNKLLKHHWPKNLATNCFFLSNVESDVYQHEYQDRFDAYLNPRHHALNDAEALREAQLASEKHDEKHAQAAFYI